MIIGDCIEIMSKMSRDSFTAVVTSPPYNIGVDYGSVSDKLPEKEYDEFTKGWISEALRVAKVAVVNFGAPTSRPMNIARFMNNADSCGVIQSDIIWLKSISTPEFTKGHFKPVNSKRFITNLVEHIFVISRDGRYELDRLAVGVPFKDKSNIGRFSSNYSDLRCRGNVWFVPYKTRNEKNPHPATYPEELCEMMVKLVRPSSVLDPFAGSGTTGRVCADLQIPCEMIDIREWP